MIFYTNLLVIFLMIALPWALISVVFKYANKGVYSYAQVIYNLIYLTCSLGIFIVFMIEYNVFPDVTVSLYLILLTWGVSIGNLCTFSFDIFKIHGDISAKKREAKKIMESLDQ